MNNQYFAVLASIFFSIAFSPSVFSAPLVLEYQPALSSDHQIVAKKLQGSPRLTQLIGIINLHFPLQESVTLVMGAKEDPLYDPETQKILMSYSFYREVENYFIQSEYVEKGTTLDQAVMDAILHTVLHEFSHALINQYQIPILAREEDAADSFANVFLIELIEGGGDAVNTAADLYFFESPETQDLETADFWDEHTLSIQRYYHTLCHLYGSDPEAYKTLLSDAGIPKEREEFCIEEWELVSSAWLRVIKDTLPAEGL